MREWKGVMLVKSESELQRRQGPSGGAKELRLLVLTQQSPKRKEV